MNRPYGGQRTAPHGYTKGFPGPPITSDHAEIAEFANLAMMI